MNDSFEIWQIRHEGPARDLMFMGSSYLARHDIPVDIKNYEKVYSGELVPNTTLENLYTEFNIYRPDDFCGHSMSVSDLVILNQDGVKNAYFCDSIGFLNVTEFVFPEQENTRTSESKTPENALRGVSKAEIEETVLNRAQDILTEMGLTDEVQLHGARVYGSRTREGLYRADSDIDVLLSYSGSIREDAFFDALHDGKWEIAGLPVDVNPISTERTGTLEDYLKRTEKYLDAKEQEMNPPSIRERLKAAKQQKSQASAPEKAQERKKGKGEASL